MVEMIGLDNMLNSLGAAGALGLAASGLVDTSKLLMGGISNVGFAHIKSALNPYAPALRDVAGEGWENILYAQWVNGVPKDMQKSKAKALIRLGLSPDNAKALAGAAHVDAEAFARAVGRIQKGADIAPEAMLPPAPEGPAPAAPPAAAEDGAAILDRADMDVVGRFDASIEAAIDAALELADQQYRNASKFAAGAVAVLLSVSAGYALYNGHDAYWGSNEFGLAFVIGAISGPLGPIAKDVASSLQLAAKALKTSGG